MNTKPNSASPKNEASPAKHATNHADAHQQTSLVSKAAKIVVAIVAAPYNDRFLSKWFAHGATELANMVLHGHPAPVYDNGSVFGRPKESDDQPQQVSTANQPKVEEQAKPVIATAPTTDAKPEASVSHSLKAQAKSETAQPNVPTVSSESGVEQRMQEILAMEAAPSMQQQQQMSH